MSKKNIFEGFFEYVNSHKSLWLSPLLIILIILSIIIIFSKGRFSVPIIYSEF